MSSSSELFARAQQLIPGGVNSPVRAFRSVGGAPFFTKSAQGATLTTVDGKELIDFVCTWGPAIHGHNHARIKAAIAAALERGTSFGTPNPYEVEMAELIVKFVPSIQKVRMCNSGTEATMSAIRLARGFTKRDKIIKFAGCYHGHSDSLLVAAGSGALTHGNPDSAGVPAALRPRDSRPALQRHAPPSMPPSPPTPARSPASSSSPTCGNVGFIMPDAGYLQPTCARPRPQQRHGAHFRRGHDRLPHRARRRAGASSRSSLTSPVSAKSSAAALPVGAFGGRADIMDHLAPLGPVYQAGTLSGNPLAMAAGIASLQMLEELESLRQTRRPRPPGLHRRARRRQNQGPPAPSPAVPARCSASSSPQPWSATTHRADLGRQAVRQASSTPASPVASTCRRAPTNPGFLSTAHEGPAIARACEVITKAIKSL
jgi:glutamate-1-semialdehyde 2,1-aminomutase